MSENKTQPTDLSVDDFIAAIEKPTKRHDAARLNTIFKDVTGFAPVMWGASIIGYGRYDYVYESGRSGSFLATGFSPRKANFSIYIMPGYANFAHYLAKLGKHKTGKSCLYVNKLADIDEAVLADIISAGLKDLNNIWPVQPS